MSDSQNQSQSAADDRPHKEPTDAEEVYYEGSPPWRGLGGKLLLWPLVGLILIAAPFLLHRYVPSSGPPLLAWVICILVGLAFPMVPVLWAKTKRYRITNYRIDF